MRSLIIFTLAIIGFLRGPWAGTAIQTPPSETVVRAVLFYSPTCGHCHYVMTEVLPPLVEQYGDRLQILAIDASQPDGQVLFMATLKMFNLESGGVPFLVVGDTYLVGSVDIPEKFPGLIETLQEQGGIDWPAIPGLAEVGALAEATASAALPPSSSEPAVGTAPDATPAAPATAAALPSAPTASAPQQAATPPAALQPTGGSAAVLPVFGPDGELPAIDDVDVSIADKFSRDLSANILAVVVLAAMVCSLLGAFLYFRRGNSADHARYPRLLIPVLCLVGMGVAGYLAYVETMQTQAVCGPIGDCNTVQQSEYARLFGILPIGVLGVGGYLAVLLAWLLAYTSNGARSGYAALALLSLTTFGVLFSIYLTFLEPFVIGATCAWCLTSAVIMTALFWLSAVLVKSIGQKPGNAPNL